MGHSLGSKHGSTFMDFDYTFTDRELQDILGFMEKQADGFEQPAPLPFLSAPSPTPSALQFQPHTAKVPDKHCPVSSPSSDEVDPFLKRESCGYGSFADSEAHVSNHGPSSFFSKQNAPKHNGSSHSEPEAVLRMPLGFPGSNVQKASPSEDAPGVSGHRGTQKGKCRFFCFVLL